LHIGQASRNGLFAALLAEGEFDAAADALEHRQGFYNCFNGPGTFDPKWLLEGWGDEWQIQRKSIALKQFPCCGSTHPAIAMAIKLKREEKVSPDDIAHIEILPHARRLPHTDRSRPQTPLEAKFSVQYVVARALRNGALRLKDFEGEAHLDPEIGRLLDVTVASPHPDMPDDAECQWGAEVIVTLKNGIRLMRRTDNLIGRSSDNPMDSSELWDKFSDCASRSLPREQIAPLFERLETLEKVTEVQQVTRLLEVSDMHHKPVRKVVFAPRGAQEAPETTWVP
jgi:2-methylcitrate dehydratase PrpD